MVILSYMKKWIHNFIHCGLLGWCLEIIFTALDSFRRREFRLKGQTSVWMFPIYGMAVFLAPISKLLSNRNIWFRGGIYTLLIFITEYCTGYFLKKKELCPWDYSRSKWNINGLIRIDYLPFWFVAGLLFERLLKESQSVPEK